MPQVEAGACERPVIGIKAMGMLDTLVHNQTALLASIAQEIRMRETMLDEEGGSRHRVVFKRPRTVDYRASVHDIANYLIDLMTDAELRARLGRAARQRVVELFDYRVVARRVLDILHETLGLT